MQQCDLLVRVKTAGRRTKERTSISKDVFSGLLGGHQPFYIQGLAHTTAVIIIYHTLHKMDSEFINV